MQTSTTSTSPSNNEPSGVSMVNPWPWLWSRIQRRITGARNVDDLEGQRLQIEDYPQGYPRFSAFLASHSSFHLCRRFSNLRTRLLLLKQDRLTALEEQLEALDRADAGTLSLGSTRADRSEQRSSVLSEISEALTEFDDLLERHRRNLGFEDARRRDVSNVQNWLARYACIARKETAYLDRVEDLISVSPTEDCAMTRLEELIEDGRVYLYERFHEDPRPPRPGVSRDANMYIFSPPAMRRAARILATPILTALLLAPVIICNLVSSMTARLVVVAFATTGFIALLSSFTRARTVELIIAGATYTTVLVVFISSTDGLVVEARGKTG